MLALEEDVCVKKIPTVFHKQKHSCSFVEQL